MALAVGGAAPALPVDLQHLAPTLFNTYMDWIIGRAITRFQFGTTLGNINVTDLDFADDVAILSFWDL